jgi:hypothetical protein
VGLVFSKAPVTRQAFTVGIAEDKFLIPAHQDNVPVAASMTVAQETRLLSFMPHMHLRGKDFRYTLNVPGQAPEILLSVPAYDFGWQSYYTLAKSIMLPKGARIDCLAHYDNSDQNPYNPDPSRTVHWGDQTFEEMMIGYIDVDLPVGQEFRREPGQGTGPGATGAVARVLGTLLGRRKDPALAPASTPASAPAPATAPR